MRHMIGFILFWIAIGMTIMFFISNAVIAVLIILLCLVLGVHRSKARALLLQELLKQFLLAAHYITAIFAVR